MAGPIAAAAVGGALSILGGIGRNKAITRQANENWNNTLTILGVQRGVNETNLLFQGDEINRGIATDLRSLLGEQKVAKADAVASTAERNAYGNTAARTQGQVDMKAAQMADNIAQSGDAAMMGVQANLTNTMYEYNNGTYQASQQRANALNQRQGTFEMLAGAASQGFSFASGYSTMKGM